MKGACYVLEAALLLNLLINLRKKVLHTAGPESCLLLALQELAPEDNSEQNAGSRRSGAAEPAQAASSAAAPGPQPAAVRSPSVLVAAAMAGQA